MGKPKTLLANERNIRERAENDAVAAYVPDDVAKEKLKEFFKKLNPFKKKNVEKEAENTAEKAKDAAEEATKK